jgi:hypothetical protein
MATHALADLMSIGQHCSAPGCGQLDFLPFTCDACAATFCLEHRAYGAHTCPAAAGRDADVIVCPICAKGVRLGGRDANAVFDEHARSDGCDPRNYDRVHRKPRCPVPGCRERLTTINAYGCRRCGQRVCLKHRLEEDHGCSAAAARAQRGAVWCWLGRCGVASHTPAAALCVGRVRVGEAC